MTEKKDACNTCDNSPPPLEVQIKNLNAELENLMNRHNKLCIEHNRLRQELINHMHADGRVVLPMSSELNYILNF